MKAECSVDLLASPRPSTATCRSQWASPLSHEMGAPARRIIHVRSVRMPEGTRLSRLGLRSGNGYFKCGSRSNADRISAYRLLIWKDQQWIPYSEMQGVPELGEGETYWVDLEEVEVAAAVIECRRSDVDGWWPSWNLANTGLVLEGSPGPNSAKDSTELSIAAFDVSHLRDGISAKRLPGEIRFRSPFLEVGFRLQAPGFSYFAIDGQGNNQTGKNVLSAAPTLFLGALHSQLCHYSAQGIRLHPVGSQEAIGFLQRQISGTTRVEGNIVRYDVSIGDTGQRYELQWEVLPTQLKFQITRTTSCSIRAWESSAWHIGFNGTVVPPVAFGKITQVGETGLMSLPVMLHWPGMGLMKLESTHGNAVFRSDCIRPIQTSTAELKVGEIAQPEGDYLLPAGRYEATVVFSLTDHQIPLSPSAPTVVTKAVRSTLLAGLPFRADTATLSNNGQSMHAPICMDCWSALAIRTGDLFPGLSAMELLRHSLERWLNGAPGYGSGKASRSETLLEDEYLMTGVTALSGLADYLKFAATSEWLERHWSTIAGQIEQMRKRDLDGDGLIESAQRLGISGRHEWSTCFYDVISFGWKDAFSNALLYQALTKLRHELLRFGKRDIARSILPWTRQLHESYAPTFLNPDTGWLAGWKCHENRLHDYAFLFVNGAAVSAGLLEPETARSVIQKLWDEVAKSGFGDFRLGLPGNLRAIPQSDLASPQSLLPDDAYQNRGATHSQSRHFVQAMYDVGMKQEADFVLHELCSSLADGSAFSGCGSGVDWRRWDGSASGYEGLLSDQFGILAVAVDRYR
jgi:hypothetical protein